MVGASLDKAFPKVRAIAILRQIPLLKGLENTDYEHFLDISTLSNFHAGDRIFEYGDMSESMFICLSGVIDILDQSHERIHLIRAGEVLGEIGIVAKTERSASAVAVEDSVLIELSAKQLNTLLYRHPRISSIIYKNLACTMAERLIQTTKNLHK